MRGGLAEDISRISGDPSAGHEASQHIRNGEGLTPCDAEAGVAPGPFLTSICGEDVMAERDDKTGQFLQGVSGNPTGRPKGARNKLGEAFIEDMLVDWEANGPAAIVKVRTERPDTYLKVVASILPRDLNVNINQTDHMTDEQLLERIRTIDAAIRPFLDAEGEGRTIGGSGTPTAH